MEVSFINLSLPSAEMNNLLSMTDLGYVVEGMLDFCGWVSVANMW